MFRAFRSSSLGARAAVIAAVASFAAAANADLSSNVFTIEATNSEGTGWFAVDVSEGTWSGDSYNWSGGGIDIMDDEGDIIASLTSASVGFVADPIVTLAFDVVAGAADTTFSISSGLLSFPTIFGATARASTGLTLTAAGQDNGAVLTGNIGDTGGSSWESRYNGLLPAPAGTQFREYISGLSTAVPGGSTSTSATSGPFVALADPVSSMSTRYGFRLSALDSASGTSVFVIVPEPASIALVAIGLLALRRR